MDNRVVVDAEQTPSSSPSPSASPSTVTSSQSTPSTPSTTSTPGPTASPSSVPKRGTALAALAALPVKGRAPMTGYDRARFGPAWLDADRNGCDTRNDVLRRDLTALVLKPGTGGCAVLEGTLADPYTDQVIRFVRGGADEVDIDHVVALGNAWATGAFRWGIRKRAALANDPLNLLAVDFRANRQKRDADAATWLPPHKAYRCSYVARQVAVKRKYSLWVTPPERDAIRRVLSSCPAQRLPVDRWRAPVQVDHDISDPGTAPSASAPAAPAAPASPQPLMGSVHFENCDAARAAGAAPVHRGDPGYGRHLDRDGDGVGCE